MHFLRSILIEIKTVYKNVLFEVGGELVVFRDLERLYMSALRRVVKCMSVEKGCHIWDSRLKINEPKRVFNFDQTHRLSHSV